MTILKLLDISFLGSYIFIESSRKNPGEKARLLSDWIGANETVCVQFWYHMHGSDIGDLNIYVKTNQSEALVWRLSGDQGNHWRFGQTALNSPNLYKVSVHILLKTQWNLKSENLNQGHVLSTFILYPFYFSLFEGVKNKERILLHFRTNILSYFSC